jgi:hypothetical protein
MKISKALFILFILISIILVIVWVLPVKNQQDDFLFHKDSENSGEHNLPHVSDKLPCDDLVEFKADYMKASDSFANKEFKNVVILLEKYPRILEMLFDFEDQDEIDYDIIEETNEMLMNSYACLGEFSKAQHVAEILSGLSDYGHSNAGLMLVQLGFLNNDLSGAFYHLEELHQKRLNDNTVQMYLLWIISNYEGSVIQQHIRDSLYNRDVINPLGKNLIQYMLDQIPEDQVLRDAASSQISLINFYIALKHERVLRDEAMAMKYYSRVTREADDIYRGLSARRMEELRGKP